MDMTNDEALQTIRKGQDIMVRRCGRRVARRAYVLRDPQTIAGYVVVDYAFYKPGYTNTISRHDHMAVVGQEEIEVIA